MVNSKYSKDVDMLVKNREDQTLIQVMNPDELINPLQETVQGKPKAGEEVQPVESYPKSTLIFPSGESLPQCWIDPEYQADLP
jgi:hypothetical protein